MTDHPIPDEALNSHVGILGKTGSGKTYTAKGLAERLLEMRRQVVIVDPTGAWYGLRTGFDIPIFGGRHGDIEISDAAGEAVARVIVEQRASAIIDLSLMTGGGQKRFMREFAHRLRQKPPGAIYLFLDEADEFLPQEKVNAGRGADASTDANLFGDLKWMVRRGRLSGFRVFMITQRPAEIAKAVLTQIETLVAHRLTAPQDRKAIEEWVKGHHDAEEAKEVLTSLASLEKGVAWVWAPDLNILTKARMPPIATFDSSRTPEPGETAVEQPALSDLDLSAIRDALINAEEVPEKLETALMKGAEVRQLRERISYLEALNQQLERDERFWKETAEHRLTMIQAARDALQDARIPAPAGDVPAPPTRRDDSRPAPERQQAPAGEPKKAPKADKVSPSGLNAAAEALAGLLKGYSNLTPAWSSLLVMGGFRPGSGWIRKSENQLIEQGYIEREGLVVRATDKLRKSDIIALPLRSPAELRALWREKLRGPGGEIAAWLAENGPATRQEIAEGIGKSATAGWTRKGFKDVLGSSLAREEGGRLVPHPLLVG